MNSFARALLPGQAANERADKTFDSILVVLNLFPCFPSYYYQNHILLAVARTVISGKLHSYPSFVQNL